VFNDVCHYESGSTIRRNSVSSSGSNSDLRAQQQRVSPASHEAQSPVKPAQKSSTELRKSISSQEVHSPDPTPAPTRTVSTKSKSKKGLKLKEGGGFSAVYFESGKRYYDSI
jgi:hypothetical protein